MTTKGNPVIEVIGKFGFWHFKLLSITICFAFLQSMQMISMSFLAPRTDHWCSKPGNLKNISDKIWVEKVMVSRINYDGKIERSACEMYNFPFENMTDEEFTFGNFSNSNVSIPCKKFSFNKTEDQHSLTDKWDMVCQKDYFHSLANSLGLAGQIFSSVVFGQLSDRFGRRPIAIICNIIWALSSIAIVFNPFYEVFIILRFVTLGAGIGTYTIGFVTMSEGMDSRARTVWSALNTLGFGIGILTITCVTYFIDRWEYIQAIISIPVVLILIFNLKHFPESPIWLLVNRRYDECIEQIEKVVKSNKLESIDQIQLLKKFKQKYDKLVHDGIEENKKTAFDLMRTPRMRTRSLIMFFSWFVIPFLYYSFILNAAHLSGDFFLNHIILGSVDIVSKLLTSVANIQLGRKKALLTSVLICSLGCFLIIPVPNSMHWLTLSLTMLSFLGSAISFTVLYIYSSEIFPTPVRNVGVGVSSMFGRIGTAVSPFLKELQTATNQHIPLVIPGGLAILCFMLCFFLPDTSNKKLPETIEEVENES